MPIIVEHRPRATVSGRVAAYIGTAQRAERERDISLRLAEAEEDRSFQREMLYRHADLAEEQSERQAELSSQARREAAALQGEVTKAEAEGQAQERERQRAFEAEKLQFGAQTDAALVEQRGRQDVELEGAKAEAKLYVLSATQEKKRQQILDQMDEVENDPTLTDDERQYALDDLKGQLSNLKPGERKRKAEWPETRTLDSGGVIALEPDGSIRPLFDPPKPPTPEKPQRVSVDDVVAARKAAFEILTTIKEGTTDMKVFPSKEAVNAYAKELLDFWQTLQPTATSGTPQGQTGAPQGVPMPPSSPAGPTPGQGQPKPPTTEELLAALRPEDRAVVEREVARLTQAVKDARTQTELDAARKTLQDYLKAIGVL